MDKIRVIHFVDRIGRGGTQAVLYDWLNNIDRSKIQFDFLVFMDGQKEFEEKFKELGCNIFQISKLQIRSIPKFMSELDCFFQKHKYDIAHGHSKSKNLFFLYAAKKNGIAMRIAHSHNTQFQKMAFIGELMKPFLKLVATDYYACSDVAGTWLFGKKAYSQGRIKIIKNGVNTAKFKYDDEVRTQYRESLGLVNNIVYGHVGKYMEQKNHVFLLDIFSEIYRLQPSAKLLLIGGGEDAVVNVVNQKIENLGIKDAVIQLGLRSDVPNLMQAMDVFLLPSLYEGLPVVGVEAQTAGLPLLLSDTITREVGLLESTQYMSLNQTAEEWACEAIRLSETQPVNRTQAGQMVYNQGYDSQLVARYIEHCYIEGINR